MHGAHCAFTDIITFKGQYYLGFMVGTKHKFDSETKCIILKSPDGENWSQAQQLYCQTDTREPKFVEFDGKLYAFFFTLEPCADNKFIAKSWMSSTSDGMNWTEPIVFAEGEKYWRPRRMGNKLYCVTHPLYPSENSYCRLVSSSDGASWEHLSNIPIDPMRKPNEASIAFDEENNLYVFIRTDLADKNSYVIKSKPPYVKYETYDMHRQLSGPLIWLKNNEIYLGARFYTKFNIPHSGIFKFDDKMEPVLITVLPSMGDSSYMGITKKIDGDGYFLSYYSSHENLNGDNFSSNKASIYLVDISG